LTRREIKEDKLLILTSRASMFLEQNLWAIVGVVAAAVLIVIGYNIYAGWNQRQAQQGMAQVAELETLFDAQQYDQVAARADRIISGHIGLPDRIARLYKADALRAKGDFAAAKRIYEDWSPPKGDEVSSFRAAKGFADCLSAEQQYARAGDVMRNWADDHKASGLAPHALLVAATNYELAGRYAEARGALKRILDEYPDAQVVGRARQRNEVMDGAAKALGERG
jgi:hypothetical protein